MNTPVSPGSARIDSFKLRRRPLQKDETLVVSRISARPATKLSTRARRVPAFEASGQSDP